ncbi:MAG: threonine/serine exporter family protein [Micrococcus sp.]|nr:threonine/serine exporter family protein [Micrococcus sp.]
MPEKPHPHRPDPAHGVTPDVAFDPHVSEPPVELSAIPIIQPAHAEPVLDPVMSAHADLSFSAEDAGFPDVVMSDDVVPDAVMPAADAPLTEPPLSEPVPTSVLDAAPARRSRLRRPRLRRPSRPRTGSTAADALADAEDADRHVFQESLPTQALALVNRVSASAYGGRVRSRISARKDRDEEAAEVRAALDFALKLGETMFSYGASSLDVESSIIVVTQTFGIHEIEVDLTNQAISLNYQPDSSRGQLPYTLQRVVRSWSTNFAGLGALHRLVEDIADGSVTRDQAQRRLVEIRHTPKPYPVWMEYLFAGVFVGLFVPYIGGSILGAVIGFVSTLIVFWAKIRLERWGLPEFFSTMIGAFLATAIALTLFAMDVPINPSIVIAGGIMMLLPAARFVMALQDAMTGFPLTAAGRLVSAMLVYMGLIGGITVGVVGANIAGFARLDLAEAPPTAALPALVLMALVACAAMSDSVVEQATWKTLLACAGVGALAYLGFLVASTIGFGPRLSPAIAATVVGFAGRLIALKLGSPPIVVVLPSMLFLLPGLMIFRALYGFSIQEGTIVEGMAGMLTATVIIVAIAAGVVFGDTLARPLTDRLYGRTARAHSARTATGTHQR